MLSEMATYIHLSNVVSVEIDIDSEEEEEKKEDKLKEFTAHLGRHDSLKRQKPSFHWRSFHHSWKPPVIDNLTPPPEVV
ncbi:MAG: hypothetical protein Tsb0034_16890 [Ekhidna sp.]